MLVTYDKWMKKLLTTRVLFLNFSDSWNHLRPPQIILFEYSYIQVYIFKVRLRFLTLYLIIGTFSYNICAQTVLSSKISLCLLRCFSPLYVLEAPARCTSWLWAEATCWAGRGPRPALFLLLLLIFLIVLPLSLTLDLRKPPLMSCQPSDNQTRTNTATYQPSGAVDSNAL